MNPTSRMGSPARLSVRGGAVDVFIAALALGLIAAALSIAISAGGRAYQALAPRLHGDLTVAVRAKGLESADAAAALATERLASLPDVAAADPLEPDPLDELAGTALFGSRASPGDTRLISVSLKPGSRETGARIARALDEQGLIASVDDHRGLAGPLESALARLGAIAGAGLVLTLLLMALFAWLSGRRQAARGMDRFDLARRLGAAPGFAGRVVSAVSWRAALGGAALGALASAAVIGVFGLGRLAQVLPVIGAALRPAPVDMAIAAAWPILLCVIAGIFAGLGARGAMAREEF